MKQVIRRGLKEIIVDDVPDPVVTPHHLVVRPLFSLISSGTETASIHQESLLKEVADNPSHLRKVWEVMKVAGPIRTAAEVIAKFSEYAVLGYSGAGIVVAKHGTVSDIELGDRVAYGGEGTGHGQALLVGRNLAARVPARVRLEDACFATLGSIAMNGVRLAEIGIGDTVAVIGMGLVGQLVAQLAHCQGGRVIAIDLRQERVELARRLGAEHAILADDMLGERVASLTDGRGADVVMVAAAAKSSQPSRLALGICRDRGRMVVLGAVDLSFPWNEMYLKEVQLFMSRAYGPGSYDAHYEHGGGDYPFSYVRWTENRNMEEFLRLLERGKVDVRSLVSHTFPLEEAARAYDTILNPQSRSLAVLLGYPEAPPGPYRPVTRVETGKPSPPRSSGGTLGVALVGAGNLARWAHLPDVKKERALELRAICSANGARGKSYARRFGASYCTSNLDDVLSDPTVHVVLITTRNEHHTRQAIAALRAGKHVFVEKPMALTEDECRDVCAAVRDTGRGLAVGFNRRFAPYYMRLKEQLVRRTGPAVVNARVNSPGIAGAYWMADPKTGGAILGEACHFVDLFYWLLGSEPTLVSAFSLPTDRSEPVGQNNLVASFRFDDGSIANLTYCTVGTATSGGERVEFFAPGVSSVTEDFKRLTISGSRRVQSSRWFAEKGYAGQLGSFVEAIRAGSPPVPGERDGTRATIACLRMLESARSEMPCALDWEGVADALRSPDRAAKPAVEAVSRGDESR